MKKDYVNRIKKCHTIITHINNVSNFSHFTYVRSKLDI